MDSGSSSSATTTCRPIPRSTARHCRRASGTEDLRRFDDTSTEDFGGEGGAGGVRRRPTAQPHATNDHFTERTRHAWPTTPEANFLMDLCLRHTESLKQRQLANITKSCRTPINGALLNYPLVPLNNPVHQRGLHSTNSFYPIFLPP
jgi:hypothetical protein